MDNTTKYHSEIVQLSRGAYIKIHQSSSIFCVQEVYLKQPAIKILDGREVWPAFWSLEKDTILNYSVS